MSVVVGVGEILWDLFPDGARFGGAPANFACHAAALGAEASIVSRVGDDELGRAAVAALQEHGVGTRFVAVDRERPTGTVAVLIDSAGAARYEFASNVAWDAMHWSDGLSQLAIKANAVCFGTLAQRDMRSRQTIRRFVASTSAECLRVFDVNLRPPFVDEAAVRESLELANVLKLNEDELSSLASMIGLDALGSNALPELAQRYDLQAIAVTRGWQGAQLLQQGRLFACPGRAIAVVDTVGAGDAFAAALTLGILRQDEPEDIVRRAVDVATFVCTRPGATPTLPDELRQAFR